ncbi:MAG: hypothetical protein KDC79_00925, partial [Cyclobacteriaceae bacterium]|nr:hypothetical protein [Cyclobacteriaceae bacterium]
MWLASFAVAENKAAPTFTSSPVTTGSYQASYLYHITTTGGVGAITITATGLPSGLIITDNGDGTADITGNPSISGGPFSITVTATDSNLDFTDQFFDLTISKAVLTVTAEDKARIYGDANPAFTVAYAGFVNGETASVLTTAPTASSTAVPTTPVGTVPITASGGVDENYSFTYVDGTLTISKAVLTVTAEDKARIYGDANPVFTVAYAGFVNGETASVLTTAPTASSTAVATTPVGTVPITASGGVDENYSFTYVPGTLTISKAVLTVTAEDKARIYGDANPAFTVAYAGF